MNKRMMHRIIHSLLAGLAMTGALYLVTLDYSQVTMDIYTILRIIDVVGAMIGAFIYTKNKDL